MPDASEHPDLVEAEASRVDVLAQLRALSEADRKRVLVLARRLWRKFHLQPRFAEPDDLLQEAVIRIYEERRCPPPGVGMAPFLWGVMKSVASHDLEKSVTYERHVRECGSLNQPRLQSASASPGGPSPCATGESTVIARDSLDKLEEFLEGDSELLEVLKLRAMGWKPKEIRAEFELNSTEWKTIEKRALRKLAKFRCLGGLEDASKQKARRKLAANPDGRLR